MLCTTVTQLEKTVVSGRLNPKAFPTPATRYRFFYPITHNGKNIMLIAEYEMR